MNARSALTMLAAAALVVVFPVAGQAAFPGANGRIYFSTFRDGNNLNLYSVNPATVSLATPNGDAIAVADGVNTSREDMSPVWSPDGSLLAFNSNRDGGDHEIFTYNRSTHAITQLTFNRVDDRLPAWSPIINGVMYVAWQQPGKGNRYDIRVMRSDGSMQQPLLADGKAEERSATWSPDAAQPRLAYWGGRTRSDEIYVADLSVTPSGVGVTALHQLTNTPSDAEYGPDFSPDGNQIVYSKEAGSAMVTSSSNSDLWKMNSDGTNNALLIDNQFLDEQADWSPDGTKIVFASFPAVTAWNSGAELYVLDVAAPLAPLTQITQNGAGDFQPDWTSISP